MRIKLLLSFLCICIKVSNYLCRYPANNRARWYVSVNNTAGSHDHIRTNPDITENYCIRANEHIVHYLNATDNFLAVCAHVPLHIGLEYGGWHRVQ